MTAQIFETHFTIQRGIRIDVDYNEQSDEEAPDATRKNKFQLLKTQKKGFDIESIKSELLTRPNSLNSPTDSPIKKFSFSRQSKLNSYKQDNQVNSSHSLIEKLSSLKFFSRIKEEMTSDTLRQIFNELRYEFVEQFNPVYRTGESSKRFYIILEGAVVILKAKDRLVGHEVLAVNAENLNLQQDDIDPVVHIMSHYPGYTHIKTLQTGLSFGEIALKLDIARSSTVVAAQDTHLLWMNEKAYKALLNPYFSSMLDEKLNFLKSNKLFRDIDNELIMGILLEMHYNSFTAGQIIFEEDDKAKELYFIFRGEIELSRRLPEYITRDKKIELTQNNVVLAAYGKGQLFGDLEIMMKTNRITKARVLSPKVELYRIAKNKFFDNLGSFKVFDEMKKNAEMISQYHQQIYDKFLAQQLEEKDEVMIQISQQQNGQQSDNRNIINKRVLEHHRENIIKMFQKLADRDLKVPKSQYCVNNTNNCDSQRAVQDRGVLQKVYSNSIQNYLDKIIAHKKTKSSVAVRNELSGENLTRSHSEWSLPKLRLNERKSIKPIISSICSLPKISRDNLVLQVLRQNAKKSKHPQRELRKISLMYEMASDKALHKLKSAGKTKSCHSSYEKSLQLLKVLNLEEMMKKKLDITPNDGVIKYIGYN